MPLKEITILRLCYNVMFYVFSSFFGGNYDLRNDHRNQGLKNIFIIYMYIIFSVKTVIKIFIKCSIVIINRSFKSFIRFSIITCKI